MGMPKPIPISAAERLGKTYAADQVIIYARTVGEDCGEHVTTYGKDKTHCAAAARIGDAIGRQVVKPLEALREALQAALTWHEAEDKALSKSGRSDADYHWRRLQHREQRDAIEAALGREPA